MMTARMPPAETHRKAGCRTFGLALYSSEYITLTMITSTGHFAMSQAATAAWPMPKAVPAWFAAGLPDRAAFVDVVDGVRGAHEGRDIARCGPQGDHDAGDPRGAGRARLALDLGDDVRQARVHPAGGDLAEVAEHLLGRGLAEQPEDRDQHQHGREQGEHAVVGQRGGAVGDVVVLELADRALQDGEPS